jgi:hypothetical protein
VERVVGLASEAADNPHIGQPTDPTLGLLNRDSLSATDTKVSRTWRFK